MHRTFIAAIAATALAITGFSATPARADPEDVAKALAAIAAIALVAKAIDDRNDRKAARQQYHAPVPVHPRHPQVHQPRHPQVHHQPLQPRPLPPQVSRHGLPQHCLMTANTAQGPAHVFGARCLQRNYAQANSLPRACAEEVWTQRGYRMAYDAACLRHRGFRIAHR